MSERFFFVIGNSSRELAQDTKNRHCAHMESLYAYSHMELHIFYDTVHSHPDIIFTESVALHLLRQIDSTIIL